MVMVNVICWSSSHMTRIFLTFLPAVSLAPVLVPTLLRVPALAFLRDM